MAKHIQISIDGRTGVPVHVTPIDIAEPTGTEASISEVIAIADMTDAVPGDGVFEYDTSIPVNWTFFGMKLKFNLPIRVTAKIVDKFS